MTDRVLKVERVERVGTKQRTVTRNVVVTHRRRSERPKEEPSKEADAPEGKATPEAS